MHIVNQDIGQRENDDHTDHFDEHCQAYPGHKSKRCNEHLVYSPREIIYRFGLADGSIG